MTSCCGVLAVIALWAASNAHAEEPQGAPPAVAGGGSAVLALDGLHLRLSGFLQVDGAAYRQDSVDQLDDATGRPLNETRVLIRRAHLRVDADWRFLSGALELEGSTVTSAAVRLFGAEVSARWPTTKPLPLLMLSAGLLRIPFGFENPQKDFERLFLERSSVVRALFPGENDLGVRVQGGWSALRWQLALMNGHPLGEGRFALVDPTAAKDWLGRLGIDTPVAGRGRVQAGVSGLSGTGFDAGTPSTKDSVQWHDDNGDGVVQPSELRAVPGIAGSPSRTFHRSALGADALVAVALPVLGMLTVYGELVWSVNLDRALQPADPIAAGRDLRQWGGYLGLTQELTHLFLVGVRYDRYVPDADATYRAGPLSVPSDTSYSTVAVAVAVEARPHARLTVEYDHNTNALGISASGSPVTLGGDALTLRAQLAF